MQEIKRLLIAMQHSDEHGIATPANWQIGDDVIIPPPGSCGAATERVDQAGEDYECLDWFLCLNKCPHGQVSGFTSPVMYRQPAGRASNCL